MTDAHDAYDWSQFDVYMDIRAPMERVFDAWATAAGMESFFARTMPYRAPDGAARAPTEHAAPGDSYDLTFHHPFAFSGTVMEIEPSRRFVFGFPEVMYVAIELSTVDEFTRIHLHQGEIPTTPDERVMMHMNCRSCWVYYLLNLKSVLEHDHDLRDGERGLPDNIIGVPFHATVAGGRA